MTGVVFDVPEIGKVEYRVRPVTRWLVTRYVADAEGRPAICEQKGEFENEALACDICFALSKDEQSKWGIGAEPKPVLGGAVE